MKQLRAQARETVDNAHYSWSRARAPARETVYTIYTSTASRAQERETVYSFYEAPKKARKRAKRSRNVWNSAASRARARKTIDDIHASNNRARKRAQRFTLRIIHGIAHARDSARNGLHYL